MLTNSTSSVTNIIDNQNLSNSTTSYGVINMAKAPIGTKCKTGDQCPESGVWKPEGYSTTAPIARGNRFPPYAGKAVIWVLIQYA